MDSQINKDSYNAIVAFDSLWHITHDKQKAMYQKIANLLLPGGFLIFTHGKNDSTVKGEMFGHQFYYSALDLEDVKRCLISNGFEIIRFNIDYTEETTGTRDLLVVAVKK